MSPGVSTRAKVLLGAFGLGVIGLAILMLLQLRKPLETPTAEAAAAKRKGVAPKRSPMADLVDEKAPPPVVPSMVAGPTELREATPQEKAVGITKVAVPAPQPIKAGTKRAMEMRFMHLVGRCFRDMPPHVMEGTMIRITLSAKGGTVRMSAPPTMLGTIVTQPAAIMCARKAVESIEVPMGPDDKEGEFSYIIPMLFVPPPPPPTPPSPTKPTPKK